MFHRTNRGYSLIELPSVIFILFIVLMFPLLDLACIGLRYGFVVLAAYEASIDAALAKTFQQNITGQLSAQNAAQQAASNVISRFTDIQLSQVTTRITITALATGNTTRTTAKLPRPADTVNNLYMLEPEIVAQVKPLILMRFFGMNIPGLTAPIPVRVRLRKIAENPQGLNQ